MQVVLILKSNNLDPWLLDWSQINLCKQGKITLKAKWNQDLPIFLPAPSKHRWISLRVTASHKFGHDFLKPLKCLVLDFTSNSLGKAGQGLLETKKLSRSGVILVDFADFVAGNDGRNSMSKIPSNCTDVLKFIFEDFRGRFWTFTQWRICKGRSWHQIKVSISNIHRKLTKCKPKTKLVFDRKWRKKKVLILVV